MTQVMRRQKTIDEYNFPFTFNPYTGCTFGCLYCYSIKSTIWSARLRNWGIQPNNARPKTNFINKLTSDLEELEDEPNKEVQIGNFFDPYPHIERREETTRRCLEVFTEHPEWIVHLETKSDVILRDVNIIKSIPHFQAEITITTLTHDAYFEPHAPSTQRRLEVIRELTDNDIFVRVMIMPVLGEYTDIQAIIDKAIEYGAVDFKIKDLGYFNIEDIAPK